MLEKTATSLKGKLSGVAGGFDSMSNSIMGNLPAIASVAASAIGITSAAVTKLYSLSKEGAGLQRIEDSFEGVAKSYGVSSQEILKYMSAASQGTISNSDIMLSANRAMLLGVSNDAEEMAKITEVAILRGRAMGISSSEAIEKVFTGIGRLSPKILDDLGIVTNATQKYKDYAAAHSVSVQAIDELTKREIIKQAIIEDGERLMKTSSISMNDSASSFERASVANTNYWDEFKKSNVNAFAPINDGWAKFMNNQAEALRLQSQMNEEGARGPQAAYLARQNAMTPMKAEWGREGDDVYTASSPMLSYASDIGVVLDVGLKLSEATEDYTMKLDGLNQKLNDTALTYGENSAKAMDLRGQIETLSSSYTSAFDQMALKTLQMKDATDQMQLDFALASGQITQGGYDQAVMMDKLASAYIGGQLNANQYAAAVGEVGSMVAGLNGMSSAAYIDVYIRVHGTMPGVFTGPSSGFVGGGSGFAGSGSGRALGGPVNPNTMYEVNEGGAPEILSVGGKTFLMMGGKSGHVTPAGRGESGGSSSADISALASRIPSAAENAKALARELSKYWS